MARIEIGTIDDPEATIYIDGSDELVFEDDSETARFAVSQGGPVRIENSDLRLDTRQAIEDGSGSERLELNRFETKLNDDNGTRSVLLRGGTAHRMYAQNGTPWEVYDDEGGFPAVQYDSDPSAGVLRTPNASLAVEGSGFNNNAISLSFDLTGSKEGYIISRTATQYTPINFYGSLYDFTGNAGDLRLATGQKIEWSSGGANIVESNGELNAVDENGNSTQITP